MNLIRCSVIFLSLFLFLPLSQAQFQEVGLGIGGSLYYGDLSPSDGLDNVKLVRPAVGVYFSHHFNSRLAAKLSLANMTFTGDDRNQASHRSRNLSFRSNAWELALSGEFYLIPFEPESGKNFGLFGSVGAGLLRHNPKALYAGQWYALQPLTTEGQGLAGSGAKPYSLYQFVIPVTGGIKYAINDQINLFLELGPRITFTDYLDDVSTSYADEAALRAAKGDIAVALSYRGNEVRTEPVAYPSNTQRGGSGVKDYYFQGLVGISLNLGDMIGNRIGSVRCPKF